VIGWHLVTTIIAMAVPFGGFLLAFRWDIRVKEEILVTLKTSRIVLGVIPEFDGAPLRAIQPR